MEAANESTQCQVKNSTSSDNLLKNGEVPKPLQNNAEIYPPEMDASSSLNNSSKLALLKKSYEPTQNQNSQYKIFLYFIFVYKSFNLIFIQV